MDGSDWHEIARWILLILAAGFIGQFGKRLADYLLARRRRSKAEAQNLPPADPGAPAGDKEAAKIAKKAAKAAVKKAKKAD